jgi:hypothetical protein
VSDTSSPGTTWGAPHWNGNDSAIQAAASGVTHKFMFGEVSVDVPSREVWVRGKIVTLSRLEFDLLLFFLRRPNTTITRAEALPRCMALRDDRSDPDDRPPRFQPSVASSVTMGRGRSIFTPYTRRDTSSRCGGPMPSVVRTRAASEPTIHLVHTFGAPPPRCAGAVSDGVSGMSCRSGAWKEFPFVCNTAARVRLAWLCLLTRSNQTLPYNIGPTRSHLPIARPAFEIISWSTGILEATGWAQSASPQRQSWLDHRPLKNPRNVTGESPMTRRTAMHVVRLAAAVIVLVFAPTFGSPIQVKAAESYGGCSASSGYAASPRAAHTRATPARAVAELTALRAIRQTTTFAPGPQEVAISTATTVESRSSPRERIRPP